MKGVGIRSAVRSGREIQRPLPALFSRDDRTSPRGFILWFRTTMYERVPSLAFSLFLGSMWAYYNVWGESALTGYGWRPCIGQQPLHVDLKPARDSSMFSMYTTASRTCTKSFTTLGNTTKTEISEQRSLDYYTR